MARPTWETALAADGPKVARWIRETIPNITQDGTAARWLLKWERGIGADVYVLDRLVTRHGVHLSEVPAEVWVHG